MWILYSKEKSDVRHMLVCERDYTLGRKDADIVLENDMSISRKHAQLRITHPAANVTDPSKVPVLTITDMSKIGTMIGDKRCIKQAAPVKTNDVIWFGNLQNDTSKFIAIYESYTVTTSCLETSAKRIMRQTLGLLGGHLVNEWKPECDALIMSSLSITIKAICALITQKPIVTPKYLEDFYKALINHSKVPETINYLPPLAESQLDPREISFGPDPGRKHIFDCKVFVFLTSKQFKKLSMAVELGGGTSFLMDEPSADDDILYSPGSCVVSCDITDQTQQLSKQALAWITSVSAKLIKFKKRAIQECEVGYAVLYCSTDKFCNPDTEIVMPGVPPVSVPQTLSQNAEVSQTQKRVAQNAEVDQVRIKTEPSSQVNNSDVFNSTTSQKRKRGEKELELSEPPTKKAIKQEVVIPMMTKSPTNSNTLSKPKASSSDITQHTVDTFFKKPVSPSNPLIITNDTEVDYAEGSHRNLPIKGRKTKTPIDLQNLENDFFSDEVLGSSTAYEGRRQRGRMKEQTFSDDNESNSGGDDDMFASVPKRKKRDKTVVRQRKASSPDPYLAKESAVNIQDPEIVTDVTQSEVRISSSMLSSARPEQQVIKDEQISSGSVKIETAEFISKDDMMAVAVDNRFIVDMVKCETVTEEKSLLFRKTAPNKIITDENGNCKWKGRIVMNFKRFHKVDTKGLHALPQIIGGVDLYVHENTQTQRQDEWFEHYVQENRDIAATNHSEDDDDDLFEMTSRRVAGKKSRK